MDNAPYILMIHLATGEPIRLPCLSFEIVPPGIDEQGRETPMRLDFTPIDGWTKTLAFLNFHAVAAIEVERSAEAATEKQ